MSKNLVMTTGGEDHAMDNFYKSLMFQEIMDGDLLKEEKNVLLVISRKTLHYGKWVDYISNYQMVKMTGLYREILKRTISQLESKGIITVSKSSGVRGGVEEKLNGYSLSTDYIFLVCNKWLDYKEENKINSVG